MKKALSLLMIVCLLLATLIACTPKQEDADIVSASEKNTTEFSPKSKNDSEDSSESAGKSSGGLEVATDNDTNYGPILPIN